MDLEVNCADDQNSSKNRQDIMYDISSEVQ